MKKISILVFALLMCSPSVFAQATSSVVTLQTSNSSSTSDKVSYFLQNLNYKNSVDKDLLPLLEDMQKFKKTFRLNADSQLVGLSFLENIFTNKANSKASINKLIADANKYSKQLKTTYTTSDKNYADLEKAINKKVKNQELANELKKLIDFSDSLGIDKINEEQKQINIKRYDNLVKFLNVVKIDNEATTFSNGTVITESGDVNLAYWDYLKTDRDLNKRSLEISSIVAQKMNVKNSFSEFLYGSDVYANLDLTVADYNKLKSVWSKSENDSDLKSAVPQLIVLIQELGFDTLSNTNNLDMFLKIKSIENEQYLENLGFISENFKTKQGLQIVKTKLQDYLTLKKKYRQGVYSSVVGISNSKPNLKVSNILLSISDNTFEATRKEVYAEYALESDSLEKISTVNLLVKYFGKFKIEDDSSSYYFKFNNSVIDAQYRSKVDKKHKRFDWSFEANLDKAIQSTPNTSTNPSVTSSTVETTTKHLLQINASVLMPKNWFYLYEKNGTGVQLFYISKEQVINSSDMFKTGLTLTAIASTSLSAPTAEETAKKAISKIASTGTETITREDVSGVFKIFIVSKLMIDPDYNYRTTTKYFANTKTNTLYAVTFEAPDLIWKSEWDNIGNQILQSLNFDQSK